MSNTKHRSLLRQLIWLQMATKHGIPLHCDGGFGITNDLKALEHSGALSFERYNINTPKYYNGCTYGDIGYLPFRRKSNYVLTENGRTLLEELTDKFKKIIDIHRYNLRHNYRQLYYGKIYDEMYVMKQTMFKKPDSFWMIDDEC